MRSENRIWCEGNSAQSRRWAVVREKLFFCQVLRLVADVRMQPKTGERVEPNGFSVRTLLYFAKRDLSPENLAELHFVGLARAHSLFRRFNPCIPFVGASGDELHSSSRANRTWPLPACKPARHRWRYSPPHCNPRHLQTWRQAPRVCCRPQRSSRSRRWPWPRCRRRGWLRRKR